MKTVDKREGWNKPAPPEYGLPTETWREHVARRRRYEEVRGKLAAGEISSVNDLVTCNLDIEQFALDAINHSEGPELVRAFWKAIRDISILDPTGFRRLPVRRAEHPGAALQRLPGRHARAAGRP